MDMNFAFLAVYPKIIVTGPQRSGTTITTHMIHNDLKGLDSPYHWVDEANYQVHNEDEFRKYLSSGHRLVIQAPAMLHLIPEYGIRDDVAVVMMFRPTQDVIASQERIGWVHEYKALQPFVDVGYIDSADPEKYRQATVKYQFWGQKKEMVRNPFEIQYQSLQTHPMWIEDRAHFHARQYQ